MRFPRAIVQDLSPAVNQALSATQWDPSFRGRVNSYKSHHVQPGGAKLRQGVLGTSVPFLSFPYRFPHSPEHTTHLRALTWAQTPVQIPSAKPEACTLRASAAPVQRAEARQSLPASRGGERGAAEQVTGSPPAAETRRRSPPSRPLCHSGLGGDTGTEPVPLTLTGGRICHFKPH